MSRYIEYVDWFDEFLKQQEKEKNKNTKKIWEILKENDLVNNEQLKDWLEYQEKMKKHWIYLTLIDALIGRWYLKSRSTIFSVLQDNSIDLRFWELLFKDWLINENELNKAILKQNHERINWRNVSFWEILIEKWFITEDELVNYLQNKWIQLTNSEIIIHYWILTKFHLDYLTKHRQIPVDTNFLEELIKWWLMTEEELELFKENIIKERSNNDMRNLYDKY